MKTIVTTNTVQCHGTNRRYAVRCRRLSRPGKLTCGIHKDQEAVAQHMAEFEEDRA